MRRMAKVLSVTTHTLNAEHLSFYLEGRENPLNFDKLDMVALANKVLTTGAWPREVALEAAKELARPLWIDDTQKTWSKKKAMREAIAAAGGDADKAFALYLTGQIDQAAVDIEHELLDECDALAHEDSDEDDDDGEDDDVDDEDDGEEDEEDDVDEPSEKKPGAH